MTQIFPVAGNADALRAFVNDISRKTFLILFTPRSGSSRITDILSQTRKMGTPVEWFNPGFIPRNAEQLKVDNLDDYCMRLGQRFRAGGIFGAEITYHHIAAVFQTNAAFMERFSGATFFWLTRDDIVAQAVSLHKMVVTQITHATQLAADDISKRETGYTYDAPQIKRWLEHILVAEERTETLIKEYELTPFRMTYEENARLSEAEIAARFLEHMGAENHAIPAIASQHRKLATEKSADFAQRFRDEYSGYLAEVAARRVAAGTMQAEPSLPLPAH